MRDSDNFRFMDSTAAIVETDKGISEAYQHALDLLGDIHDLNDKKRKCYFSTLTTIEKFLGLLLSTPLRLPTILRTVFLIKVAGN